MVSLHLSSCGVEYFTTIETTFWFYQTFDYLARFYQFDQITLYAVPSSLSSIYLIFYVTSPKDKVNFSHVSHYVTFAPLHIFKNSTKIRMNLTIPPVDLYLNFEKSSSKTQVQRTGFLVCIPYFLI